MNFAMFLEKYYKENIIVNFLEGEGGFKIKILYKKLLEEFIGDYKATAGYTDENINYALTIHEGDSIPGFPSVDAFISTTPSVARRATC